MRLLSIFVVSAFMLAHSGALAQDGTEYEFVNTGRVNVQMEGLFPGSLTSGNVQIESRLVAEMVRELDEPGKIRVVPIVGYGQEENARDLLLLHGVEFGVMNSDMLHFLRIEGRFPSAGAQLRSFFPLAEKVVAVVARNDVNSVQELAGKRIAVRGAGAPEKMTARTLFSLLKTKVRIVPVRNKNMLDVVSKGDAAATVIIASDAQALATAIASRKNLTVLDIPNVDNLSKTYGRRTLELAGGSKSVETVTLQSVLAVFNWPETSTRYPNVSNFIDRLISALPTLRSRPGSLWTSVDPDRRVRGWIQFAPVAARLKATKSDRVKRLALLRKRFGDAVTSTITTANATTTSTPSVVTKVVKEEVDDTGFKLAAFETGVVSTKTRDDGGLVSAMLRDGFRTSSDASKDNRDMSIDWINAPHAQIESLLTDRTQHAGVPWYKPDCEKVGSLSLLSAVVCDQFEFTNPIIAVPYVLYSRKGHPLSKLKSVKETRSKLAERTICIVEPLDVSAIALFSGPGGTSNGAKIVRRSTYAACFAALDDDRADLVFGTDLDAQSVLSTMGIGARFKKLPFPIGTTTVHAIVAKSHPRKQQILARLNGVIRSMRNSDQFQSRVNTYLSANK